MPSLESEDHHFWSRARQFELAEQIGNANAIHKLVRDSEFYFLSAIYSPFSLKMYTGSLPLETYNLYRALEFHIMQNIIESFSILRENCDGYDAHLLLQLEAQLIGEAKLRLETELIAKLNEEDLPEAVSIFTEELLMQAELSVVGSSDDQTIAYTVATVAAWLRLYHVIGQHFMNWISGARLKEITYTKTGLTEVGSSFLVAFIETGLIFMLLLSLRSWLCKLNSFLINHVRICPRSSFKYLIIAIELA
ncbi:unnamed protein product [Prunus brigantina]